MIRLSSLFKSYQDLTHTRLVLRRLFALSDFRDHARIAMVHETLLSNLPPGQVLGQRIKVSHHHFEIVGMCEIPAHAGAPHLYLTNGASIDALRRSSPRVAFLPPVS